MINPKKDLQFDFNFEVKKAMDICNTFKEA